MNSYTLDPDLIAPNTPTSHIEVKKTFEIPEDHYDPKGLKPIDQTVSDGPLGEQVPGMLPKVDIDFKILDDGKTKLISFQEVESMLMQNKAISQEEAKLIEQKMPGFLSGEKELTRFTKAPSAVRFDHSLNYVKKQIATEEDSLYKNLSGSVLAYYQAQSTQLSEFIENNLSSLTYSVDQFVQELSDAYEKVKISPHLSVALTDDTFTNVLTDPLFKVSQAAIHTDTLGAHPEYKKIIETLLSLQDVVGKAGLDQLLIESSKNTDQVQWFYNVTPYTDTTHAEALTLKDILESIFQNNFKILLENVYAHYSTYLESQQDTVRILNDLPNQDQSSVSFWYLDHEGDVKKLLMVMHRLNALSVAAPAMLLALKTFFDVFLTL